MALQYQGNISIAGVKVPVTSSSLDKMIEPSIPPLIWGGGYHINYAKGKQRYEGEISFPLFTNFVSTLQTIANVGNGTNKRDAFFSTIVDDSINQFTYANTKVSSCRISSSGDGPLQCSLGMVAKGRTVAGHVAGTGFTASTTSTALQTPIPYFNTQFTAFGIASSKIISYEISINNNPFILYTHDGTSDPNDIQLGLQVVTGSMTYYDTAASGFGFQTGSITTSETGALVDTDSSCGSLTVDGTLLWTFGLGVLKSAPRALTNPSEKPIRSVSFELLGTTSLAPLS